MRQDGGSSVGFAATSAGMGIDADAIAVAAGRLAVLATAHAWTAPGRHRTPSRARVLRAGDWTVVFFVIEQTDGYRRADVVTVEAAR
jgi:hypothetical protein